MENFSFDEDHFKVEMFKLVNGKFTLNSNDNLITLKKMMSIFFKVISSNFLLVWDKSNHDLSYSVFLYFAKKFK